MGTKDKDFVKYLLTLALTLPAVTATAAPGDGAKVEGADRKLNYSENLGDKLGLSGGDASKEAAAPGWAQIIWEQWWGQIIIVQSPAATGSSPEAAGPTSASEVLVAVRNEDD